MSERDEARARKFAVKWSTRPSQDGEIANLAGCYLRASRERADIEIALLDRIVHACGKLIPNVAFDTMSQLYGIWSTKEIVLALLKERLEEEEQLEKPATTHAPARAKGE